MARLLADEQFPRGVTKRLRLLGHDVVRLQEFNQRRSGDGKPDDEVLKIAISQNRAVVNLNRDDFLRLHRSEAFHGRHKGILACKRDDKDPDGLGRRIDDAIKAIVRLDAQFIDVPSGKKRRRRRT